MKNANKKTIKYQKKIQTSLPLPTEGKIQSLSQILVNQAREEENARRYAPVKTVLGLIGTIGVVSLALVSPGGAMVAKAVLNEERRREQNEWKQFNPYFLKRTLKRLQAEKYVEIKESNGQQVIVLTKNGKRRILKYALDQLTISKPRRWDGKWRIILYDIQEPRKELRDIFRSALQSLGFFRLQESAWLYPYPCEEQISFLREYYGVGNEALYIVANKLEDDGPYKTYFGLE